MITSDQPRGNWAVRQPPYSPAQVARGCSEMIADARRAVAQADQDVIELLNTADVDTNKIGVVHSDSREVDDIAIVPNPASQHYRWALRCDQLVGGGL